MAYKREKLLEEALRVIEKKKLFFIQDAIAFLPCSSSTFYEHELEKEESLKEALYKNKVEIKSSLRNKWYNGENSTTQIALYKLLADDNELRRLTNQNVEMKGDMQINWHEELALPNDDTKDSEGKKGA